MVKFILGLALVLLALTVLLFAVYIFKKKPEGHKLDRIAVYVTIIGVLITIIGIVYPMVDKDNKPISSGGETIQSDENNDTDKKTENNLEKPIVEENNEPPMDSSTKEANKSDTSIKNEKNNESESEDNTNNVLPEPTDSIISGQQEEQRKTVSLYETKTYSFDGNITREEVLSDPRGNNYNDAYLFGGEYYTLNTGGGKYDKPFIEKYIGGEYDSFTATIVPYKTFDKYGKDIQAKINIYADSELVYTSNIISKTMEQEKIALSVSEVKYLKIELVPATELKSYFNQYSVVLYDGILTSN